MECSGVSMSRPQLCIDAETRQDCDGKAPKQPQSRPNDCVYSPLRENAALILPRFFSHPIFRAKLKTLYLQYACGLYYFAHFDSSIIQIHIVDFVNNFGGSHFHWTSRTMFIFCGCTSLIKLIYPILNS